MPEDAFKPFDVLSQFAPHNVIASLASGGQVAMAKFEGVDVGGDGPAKAPPKVTPGKAGGKAEEEKKNGVALAGITPGRIPGGVGRVTAGGEEVIKMPQETTVKVTDRETKMPVAGAAVYYDNYDHGLGVTDFKGEMKSSGIPKGKHTILVDAEFYDTATQDIYVGPPSPTPVKRTYNLELEYLALPGVPGEPPVEPPTEPYYPPPDTYQPPYQPPPTTYQPPPTYEAPVYQAPSYGAPGYGGPSYGPPAYGAPGYQPPTTAPGAPPLPPIEYLQQLLMMPFATLQMIFATPPSAPQPPR